MLTAETVLQSLASGLLMGLLYGLVAVGLALIFGLMDVVNFAHGEFLMLAMYATFGLAGAILASFFHIYPDVGASFALIAYVTVALGGFGSIFGAFAGGILVGLVEAVTAMLVPASLKFVGIYAVYLLVVFLRPRGLFGTM